MWVIDEKNCPRPKPSDAERAAISASGAGRTDSEIDRMYLTPAEPETPVPAKQKEQP